MRAAVIERQGPIENICVREWPDPVAGPDDVVVRVKAVGLNHLDIFVRRGMPGFAVPMPFISGGDVAGIVASLGSNVSQWKVRDRVVVNPMTPEGMIGEQLQGGMCELLRVPAAQLIALPEGMTFVTAASIPINFGTAIRMLGPIGALQAGESVLIIGASGGVGTACVQLAKNAGARVIAVTRGQSKVAELARLGADHVIDSTCEDFSASAWKLTGRQGVDMVVNYTGGDTWVPSLRAMKRHARLVTCGATAGFDPKTDIRYIWTRELRILGSDGYTQDDIAQAVALVHAGKARPVISKVLPLSQVHEAERLIETGQVVGKIVLTLEEHEQ